MIAPAAASSGPAPCVRRGRGLAGGTAGYRLGLARAVRRPGRDRPRQAGDAHLPAAPGQVSRNQVPGRRPDKRTMNEQHPGSHALFVSAQFAVLAERGSKSRCLVARPTGMCLIIVISLLMGWLCVPARGVPAGCSPAMYDRWEVLGYGLVHGEARGGDRRRLGDGPRTRPPAGGAGMLGRGLRPERGYRHGDRGHGAGRAPRPASGSPAMPATSPTRRRCCGSAMSCSREHASDHVNLVFSNAGIGGGESFIAAAGRSGSARSPSTGGACTTAPARSCRC